MSDAIVNRLILVLLILLCLHALVPKAVATDIGTVRIVGPIEIQTDRMHPLVVETKCK